MSRVYIDPVIKLEVMTWIKENEESFIEKGSNILAFAVNEHFGYEIKPATLAAWAATIKIQVGKPRKKAEPVATKDLKFNEPENTEEHLTLHKNWLFKHTRQIKELEKRIAVLRKARRNFKRKITDIEKVQHETLFRMELQSKESSILLDVINKLFVEFQMDKPNELNKLEKQSD